MKRIFTALLTLSLLLALTLPVSAQSGDPVLACREDGDSVRLTLENLDASVYALQLELSLKGKCPNAVFTPDVTAFVPDCRTEVSQSETAVTIYISALEDAPENGSLRLGVLELGASFSLPETADLILLDQDLRPVGPNGTISLRIDQQAEKHLVRAAETSHGSISIQPASAAAGETVTITAAPDSGYALDRLTAVDRRGRDIPITAASNGRHTFRMPDWDVTVEAVFAPSGSHGGGGTSSGGTSGGSVTISKNPLPFVDVAAADWCYNAVRYVYEKGLMNGTTTTTFNPSGSTTRGMIVAILYRLEGSPLASGASAFTDVAPTAYYASAVAWASSNGIVNGYEDKTFRPNNLITREQMAAFLYRYAQYKGRDVSQRADLSAFTDAGQIASYAVEPIQWANIQGLVNGTSTTTLSPKGSATRAQVAVILNRFDTNIVQGRG